MCCAVLLDLSVVLTVCVRVCRGDSGPPPSHNSISIPWPLIISCSAGATKASSEHQASEGPPSDTSVGSEPGVLNPQDPLQPRPNHHTVRLSHEEHGSLVSSPGDAPVTRAICQEGLHPLLFGGLCLSLPLQAYCAALTERG